MLDTVPLASQTTAVAAVDHLGRLVVRTAAGDRAAFRCLYAFLAVSVWRAAVRGLPDSADASAVTRSTFVELWHLARHHHNGDAHTDPRAWLMAITARRVNDRTRPLAAPRVDDYDAHVHRELCDLLGPGRALIRTARGTFMSIEDLDHALAAIAATTPPRAAGSTRTPAGEVGAHRRPSTSATHRLSHGGRTTGLDAERRDDIRNVAQRPTAQVQPDAA